MNPTDRSPKNCNPYGTNQPKPQNPSINFPEKKITHVSICKFIQNNINNQKQSETNPHNASIDLRQRITPIQNLEIKKTKPTSNETHY